MSLTIQREKREFLYEQVIAMIRHMEQANTLRPGDKLPSLRSLSEKLKISIPTVKQAYGELERQGLIEARPKSGYFLKPVLNLGRPPKRVEMGRRPKSVIRQSLIERVFDAIQQEGVVALGVANPSSVHPSDKALARIMRQVTARAGARAISYGPIDGYRPLKRQLALRYLQQGLQVDPDELLITNGAQEALSIALQCVASAGDIIAVESPSYFGVLELIESLGMMALEIPLCPEEGVWLSDLEVALEVHDVKACIFSASISNPMGSFMNSDRQREIVRLLESKDIPLIEDDVYGDLHFTERRGGTAQLFSQKGLVLSCSSFSKTAAPGYRVGWLLTNKFSGHAIRLKRAHSCSTSLLNQWTLAEFLASGEYERAMRSLRQKLRLNKDRMVASLNRHMPTGTRISDPQGGGVLWVEFPASIDSERVFQKALDQQISICPGALFSPSDKFRSCIRISYGIKWDSSVERAIEQLAKLCTSK